MKAHRFVYEQIRGPIPDGMDIDHLCRVRNCVNPDHMEPVTRRENTLRGLKGRLVTHCPAGHAYSPDNLLTKTRRDCKRCHANKERARREAARLSATVAA